MRGTGADNDEIDKNIEKISRRCREDVATLRNVFEKERSTSPGKTKKASANLAQLKKERDTLISEVKKRNDVLRDVRERISDLRKYLRVTRSDDVDVGA